MATDANTCDSLAKNWELDRRAADRLELPQLVFVWATVILVLIAAVALFANAVPIAQVTAALGVLTGVAAGIVTKVLKDAQQRSDKSLKSYVKQCSAHDAPAATIEALLPG